MIQFSDNKKAGFSKVTVKEYLIMDVPVYRTFFVVSFGGPVDMVGNKQ